MGEHEQIFSAIAFCTFPGGGTRVPCAQRRVRAEYGWRLAGFNIAIKSGANQLHGSFIIFTHNAFLAHDILNPDRLLRINLGNPGGPSSKEQLFLCNYEGQRRAECLYSSVLLNNSAPFTRSRRRWGCSRSVEGKVRQTNHDSVT
jgi:hypothetical protein